MVDLTFSLQAIEYFLLVFVRVTCFIFIAPFFSTKGTPNMAKIGIGLYTSILLMGVIQNPELPSYGTVWGYGILVMKEAVTGFLVGFGAQMCTNIVTFAGRIVDTETGLAMASLMDPTTGMDTTMSGSIYQYGVMLILIISGMYQYLLKALSETFTLIPVTGAIFRVDNMLQNMVIFLGDFVFLGFRIALPVFVVMTLLNSVLGILAKVSPQMNMFAVGMQLKVIIGLSTVFLTMQMLPNIANKIFEEIQKVTVLFVKGMM